MSLAAGVPHEVELEGAERLGVRDEERLEELVIALLLLLLEGDVDAEAIGDRRACRPSPRRASK
jgi:hypothetical protein